MRECKDHKIGSFGGKLSCDNYFSVLYNTSVVIDDVIMSCLLDYRKVHLSYIVRISTKSVETLLDGYCHVRLVFSPLIYCSKDDTTQPLFQLDKDKTFQRGRFSKRKNDENRRFFIFFWDKAVLLAL